MSPEQTPENQPDVPYTLQQVIDELIDDPASFDGSHTIREAARKAGANYADVQSEITDLREKLTELTGIRTEEADEAREQIKMQLLSAYAVRASIQLPGR